MKKKLFICSALSALLIFSGCSRSPKIPNVALSSGSLPADTAEITAVVTAEDVALLDQFTALTSLNLTGSTCYAEIEEWAKAHPDVAVEYTIEMPDGTAVSSDTTALDMKKLPHSAVAATAEAISHLPSLQTIFLGDNLDGSRDISYKDLRMLQDAAPNAIIDYSLMVYGIPVSTADTELNFSHIPVDDNGAAVCDLLSIMPNCKKLDMDQCGLDDERMAEIRDAFPDTKVIWRVWFGDNYSVRTDADLILASRPTTGGNLYDYNTQSLKYCTDIRFIDLGHNPGLIDISFVQYMPKLEVAILAMIDVEDCSPLSACTNLEYLEIQTNNISDLSPLSTLVNLKHLNIARNYDICDITPLYNLPKLERVWIGCVEPVPQEQIDHLQELLPNCVINTETYDPTDDGWRYVGVYVDDDQVPHSIEGERYKLLRKQFNYAAEDRAFSYYWNDPLYYAPDEQSY